MNPTLAAVLVGIGAALFLVADAAATLALMYWCGTFNLI